MSDEIIKKLIEDTNKLVSDMRQNHEQEIKTFAKNESVAEIKSSIDRQQTDIADIIGKITDMQRANALANEAKHDTNQLTTDQKSAKDALDKLIRHKFNESVLSDNERKSLNTLNNNEGGWLTSRDTAGRIIKRVYDSSPVRRYASVQQTSKGMLTGLIMNGRNGYSWVGETETRSETTTQNFGEYEIRVNELYAYPRVSNTMLDDADFDIESLMIQDGGMGFAEGESSAFINGDGVKKPRGFMAVDFAYTGDNTRAWGTVQKFKTGVNGGFAAAPNGGDKLIDMATSLRSIYQSGAIWGMNRFTLAEVMKLKDSNGAYLWQPNFQIASTPFGTILGHPVDASFDHMADISNSSLSLFYGDLKQAYQIVDRRGISIVRDNITSPGWTKLHMSKRVGGDVINSEAYRVLEFKA